MASLYSPMVGILENVERIAADAQVALGALPGTAVTQVADNVRRMKRGCDTIAPLVPTFNHAEAIYLGGDLGTGLATALRDVELMVRVVRTACDGFEVAGVVGIHSKMHQILQHLEMVPSQAKAVVKRMQPFLTACERELGTLDTGEHVLLNH